MDVAVRVDELEVGVLEVVVQGENELVLVRCAALRRGGQESARARAGCSAQRRLTERVLWRELVPDVGVDDIRARAAGAKLTRGGLWRASLFESLALLLSMHEREIEDRERVQVAAC